jgi:hypothetical protein
VTSGEDTQEGNLVGDTEEEGVEATEGTKLDPDGPKVVTGGEPMRLCYHSRIRASRAKLSGMGA